MVEFIPLDEENDTGFGLIEVELNGQLYTVHETNNLAALYEANLHKKWGEVPRNNLDVIYYHSLERENKIFPHLVRRLAWNFNGLLEKLNDVSYESDKRYQALMRNRERLERGEPTLAQDNAIILAEDESVAISKFYFSQAFDGFASYARKIDSAYDIKNLCR